MLDNNITKKILIVDDIPENIQVLGKLLDEQDYQVIVAENGQEALDAVDNDIPNLILLDIMMPDMDGYTVCNRLKQNKKTKDIPVIYLTAKVESIDLVKGFELGAVDYITKPFNVAELLSRVKTHLDLKEKSDHLERMTYYYKELTHVLCHDLANPISVISNIVSLTETDPDIYQQFHNEMGMATNNCLNIIDLVKKLRALEDGKLCMVLRRTALEECLDESVKVFHHKLKEKNIQIKLEVPEDTEVFVERTAFINSVINNLLSNAIKFSYPGSTILLKSEKKSERIYLSIKDWGVGIPENILSHIFSISKETTRVGTEGEVGTGFGMPLVHRFVRSFGGEIEIKSSCERESASGKSGTEVILILHSHGQGMSERE